MNPVEPTSQRILRFSGVQPQVLAQLETRRLKQDSRLLFGEELDVFTRSNEKGPNKPETLDVDVLAGPKSSSYFSGALRSLNRMITGKDLKPVEVTSEPTGDVFERSLLPVESNN